MATGEPEPDPTPPTPVPAGHEEDWVFEERSQPDNTADTSDIAPEEEIPEESPANTENLPTAVAPSPPLTPSSSFHRWIIRLFFITILALIWSLLFTLTRRS